MLAPFIEVSVRTGLMTQFGLHEWFTNRPTLPGQQANLYVGRTQVLTD